MGAGDQDSGLGLAELVAAFSVATDLGLSALGSQPAPTSWPETVTVTQPLG